MQKKKFNKKNNNFKNLVYIPLNINLIIIKKMKIIMSSLKNNHQTSKLLKALLIKLLPKNLKILNNI